MILEMILGIVLLLVSILGITFFVMSPYKIHLLWLMPVFGIGIYLIYKGLEDLAVI